MAQGKAFRPKRAELVKALHDKAGNITSVARAFKVDRRTVTQYLNANPDLWTVVEDAREQVADMVEGVLVRKALEGDVRAIAFYLSAHGRRRGYGDPLPQESRRTVIKVEWADERPALPDPDTVDGDYRNLG